MTAAGQTPENHTRKCLQSASKLSYPACGGLKPRPCQVPTPALHLTLEEAHRQLPSTSALDSLRREWQLPCSLALWRPGSSKTLKTKQFKSGHKEKKVKSTNDQGCSVGTTATGMPDPPPHAQLCTTTLLRGHHLRATLLAWQLTGALTLYMPRHCALPRHTG